MWATKVSLREHRVNKAMLAICPKCVNQLNLGPKEEAPGLARARRNPTVNSKPRSFRKNNIMNKAEKELPPILLVESSTVVKQKVGIKHNLAKGWRKQSTS